ncbi:MAG: hypothetical protein IPJ69_07630 [Deltaproteobacteria bacterium]|nr:MAG: hypothetical protein IPJ69_07630 [Deltaproteobacteria bacterium]
MNNLLGDLVSFQASQALFITLNPLVLSGILGAGSLLFTRDRAPDKLNC